MYNNEKPELMSDVVEKPPVYTFQAYGCTQINCPDIPVKDITYIFNKRRRQIIKCEVCGMPKEIIGYGMSCFDPNTDK